MTQGTSIDDALEMAYDIIVVTCAYWEEDDRPMTMPAPAPIHMVKTGCPDDIVTQVHVDLGRYRMENDGRAV